MTLEIYICPKRQQQHSNANELKFTCFQKFYGLLVQVLFLPVYGNASPKKNLDTIFRSINDMSYRLLKYLVYVAILK